MNEDTLEKLEISEALCRNDSGKLVKSVSNIIYILEHDSEFVGLFKKNLLTDRVDVVKATYWNEKAHCFDDDDLHHVALAMEGYGLIGVNQQVDSAVRIVAGKNKFHPIIDKLNSLVWDGVPRVGKALHHFLGCEESELVYESMKVYMLGAINRVFHPGSKFEIVLCLVGGQGAGKSSFFRVLAMNDDWFSDDLKRVDDENVVRKLQGHWIIEMAEMVATASARYIEENKAFISRQKDTYKVPYEKYPKDVQRQCVFAGTSNKKSFLPFDRSGNRRFIPIETDVQSPEVCINDNLAESHAYVEQMWAEVMEIYRSGNYSLRLPAHVEEELARRRTEFMSEDIDAELIQAYLDDYKDDYICSHQIYQDALGFAGKPDRKTVNEINDIMRNSIVGWKQEAGKTKKIKGHNTQRYWYRVKTTEVEFEPVPEQMEIPFDSD